METIFVGRSFFPPKPLPAATPGATPLIVVSFLVIESEDISIVKVFGVPLDLKPGQYRMSVQARAKSGGKSGINYWYSSHQTSQDSKAA